jgi:hypothetical protein
MDGASSTPALDYPALMRAAPVGVGRSVLARVADEGLPGDHHFYLTFGTGDDGVEVPATLRRQFPDETTIVLQHQFWNLAVDDAGFAVTLRFAGRPERLVVPWPALRAFADPSVEFGFRLQPPKEGETDERAESARTPAADAGPRPAAEDAPAEAKADSKVVAFRRKPE